MNMKVLSNLYQAVQRTKIDEIKLSGKYEAILFDDDSIMIFERRRLGSGILNEKYIIVSNPPINVVNEAIGIFTRLREVNGDSNDLINKNEEGVSSFCQELEGIKKELEGYRYSRKGGNTANELIRIIDRIKELVSDDEYATRCLDGMEIPKKPVVTERIWIDIKEDYEKTGDCLRLITYPIFYDSLESTAKAAIKKLETQAECKNSFVCDRTEEYGLAMKLLDKKGVPQRKLLSPKYLSLSERIELVVTEANAIKMESPIIMITELKDIKGVKVKDVATIGRACVVFVFENDEFMLVRFSSPLSAYNANGCFSAYIDNDPKMSEIKAMRIVRSNHKSTEGEIAKIKAAIAKMNTLSANEVRLAKTMYLLVNAILSKLLISTIASKQVKEMGTEHTENPHHKTGKKEVVFREFADAADKEPETMGLACDGECFLVSEYKISEKDKRVVADKIKEWKEDTGCISFIF
jgi:hypothetical protein